MRFPQAPAVMAAVMAAFGAFAAVADPVEGVWQTLPDDNGRYGHVEITPCGGAFCGVLVRAFEADGTENPDAENIGRQIVWDMQAEGAGSYGAGKVWAPDRDKTYRAVMELDGDSLAVSGCVMGGLICRASQWQRVR